MNNPAAPHREGHQAGIKPTCGFNPSTTNVPLQNDTRLSEQYIARRENKEAYFPLLLLFGLAKFRPSQHIAKQMKPTPSF